MAATSRPKLLAGRKVLLLADFQFEDLELMYPKMRLEEEGAEVHTHPNFKLVLR